MIASTLSSSVLFTSLLATDPTAQGWIGSWSPGIGDPNVVGWVTVFAYLLAGFLCLRVYRRLPGPKPLQWSGHLQILLCLPLGLVTTSRVISRTPEAMRMRALWLTFTLVMFFLGVNKQLDLQTALTEMGRIMAQDGGWYAIRRQVQVVFILGILAAGAWSFRTILLFARGRIRRVRAALSGFVFLVCFVAIRATSFHHVDRLLGLDFAGFKINWILELGGIALVIVGARSALSATPPPAGPGRT